MYTLVNVAKQIKDLEKENKIKNKDFMEKLYYFCMNYPLDDNYKDFLRLDSIMEDLKDNINKLNVRELLITHEFYDFIKIGLYYIENWNLFNYIHDREHNDDETYGELEVNVINEWLTKFNLHEVFDYLVHLSQFSVYIDDGVLTDIITLIDNNKDDIADDIIYEYVDVCDDLTIDDEKFYRERAVKYIIPDIINGLNSITSYPCTIDFKYYYDEEDFN